MEKHVLVIEDSRVCQIVAREALSTLGSIETADTCAQAREKCKKLKYDLLIVDLHLPDGSGIELFAELKQLPLCKSAHCIVVSGDGEISKKLAAFSIGADDYLIKPYIKLELRARAERLICRVEEGNHFYESATGLRLNSHSFKAYFEKESLNYDLNLTPHEFRILNTLIRSPGRVYSRNQIIDIAWGENTFLSERTVDTNISLLRKKLGVLAKMLFCVRGEGYKWEECELEERGK